MCPPDRTVPIVTSADVDGADMRAAKLCLGSATRTTRWMPSRLTLRLRSRREP